MRVTLDKVASSTAPLGLTKEVLVGSHIPARPGTAVVVRVLDEKSTYNQLEDVHGRMGTVHKGDVIVGVLGARRALRGYAGQVPERVVVGQILHLLNLGGVIGECTGYNEDVGPPARVEVLGAVVFGEGASAGLPASIFPGPVPLADRLDAVPPVVLVAGTCMHAGKTEAACKLVRELTAAGYRVGATKVTGVALRRDSLELLDHGAVVAYTFNDCGLPSTVGVDVVAAARGCINAVAKHDVDVIVVELGDGLLGEYGVMDVLLDEDVAKATKALVLAALDPVAVWGGVQLVRKTGLAVTCVTGPATDNAMGISRVLTDLGVVGHNARRETVAMAQVVMDAIGGRGASAVVANAK